MLMKVFTLKPRLCVYNTVIGEYDILDKYKFSVIKFSKIKKVSMHSSINKLTNKTLTLPLFKEFIAKQCINYNQVLRTSYLKKFIITLRNSYLYLYLEILFNSFFLNNRLQKSFCESYQNVKIILIFTFNYFFINFLSEKFVPQKEIIKLYLKIKFKKQHFLIKTFLFYYFIC